MPTKLQGALAARKALKKFEPDLAKATTKELGAILKPITNRARGFVPSNDAAPSGWLRRPEAQGKWANRYFDSSQVRRGIKYKTTPSKVNRSGFRSLVSILNTSAAGAIYETAGRKSGITGNFTPRLGGQLKGNGQKKTGRLIFRAAEEDGGKAKAAVFKAIEGSVAKFNAKKGY